MSHFTVMVRVPGEKKYDDLEEVVGNMLVPYCEHDNDGKTKPFFTFQDTEDEKRKEYETEASKMARINGVLVSVYDDSVAEIKKAIARELGYTRDQLLFASHDVTDKIDFVFCERYTVADVPYRERYATFEKYMKEWCGDERDEKTGRYGYWRNEKAKWDWWTIGGRWRGQLLIKKDSDGNRIEEAGLGEVSWVFKEEYRKGKSVPGSATEVDICRIHTLDVERIAKVARERADKFWSEIDQFLSGHEFPAFEGPRDTMLALGILDCLDADELPAEIFWKKKWERQNRQGVDRYDVIAEKPSRKKLDERVVAHLNPIRPFAFLDAGGWCERGKMGWFGASSDTPESNEAHNRGFDAWLKSGDQNDWLVMVDCHI